MEIVSAITIESKFFFFQLRVVGATFLAGKGLFYQQEGRGG